ncbi:hypothetical protein LCGC14_0409060 [marine sediment metagenome]|uniref:Uncharacterized protein n=1 Tax=marine sediment metagenome TaxID=412755 RepID=A0A0F9T097_9ZZZZ
MMRVLWFLERLKGRTKCRLGYHDAYAQVLWNRDASNYSGIRIRCFRCDKILKEVVHK